MKKILIIVIGICLLVGFSLSCRDRSEEDLTKKTVSTSEPQQKEIFITVGSISRTPKEEVATFRPFANYLASRLKTFGITGGNVVIANSMEKMADLIEKGEVDIYIDSPFPISVVSTLSGAKPFLRRWKKGKAEYRSIIFVRGDSGIKTLDDLRGKMIAFDEEFSTSGYLLPKATLMEAGFKLIQCRTILDTVSPDQIGYIFSGDEENVILWVLRGKVVSGALKIEDFAELAGDNISDLKIVAKSIYVPRHVVAHRTDLEATLVTAIREILINMNEDEEGKAVLKKFEHTTKFDKFPQGAENAFKPINELAKFIESEME